MAATNTYTYRVIATGTLDSAPSNEVVVIIANPVADAYVRSGTSAGTNFGTATTVDVKSTTDANTKRNGFLRFSLAGVAATVLSAKLRLYGNAVTSAKATNVHSVADITWSETAITWNYPTTNAGGPAMSAMPLQRPRPWAITAAYVEWDVTGYIQDQKTAGAIGDHPGGEVGRHHRRRARRSSTRRRTRPTNRCWSSLLGRSRPLPHGSTINLALAAVFAAGASACFGCGSGGPDPGGAFDAGGSAETPAADADPGSPQRPPQGQAAIETWLAEGSFLGWTCEDQIYAARLGGNHGRHRICSNDLLLASTAGPYPVGAASVKLLYSGTSGEQPNGFAVGLKVLEGEGTATWYWYERRGPSSAATPLADGVGLPQCAVCHGTAVRDQVFIRAR